MAGIKGKVTGFAVRKLEARVPAIASDPAGKCRNDSTQMARTSVAGSRELRVSKYLHEPPPLLHREGATAAFQDWHVNGGVWLYPGLAAE